jgi:hypothetical protein
MTTEIGSENHECDGGACPSCGEPARLRECCECGESVWIIDCGHYPQPRPIASGRRDGSHLAELYCDNCAEEEDMPTYQECVITPCASGFGEYQCGEANGEAFEDAADLVSAMREGVAELVELGKYPLPPWAEDIRGRIHNEPGRVFAARTGEDVSYHGIVE